jgi:hydrogenase nickel incorporation protein HypA/HybF
LHELAVTENILDMVLREAKERNVERVVAVNLVIGELTGIEEECVRFYFDILSEDTPAEGAKIAIKYEKALFKCSGCGRIFERKSFAFKCPYCGNGGTIVQKGRGLYIESIEVE